MKTKQVSIDSISVPTTRITSRFEPDALEAFRSTVRELGVIEPIIVSQVDSTYYLVDGLHRLMEARARGDKTITAVVMPGSEADVLIFNILTNTLRGKPAVGEVRQVLETLYSEHGLGVDEISQRTGLPQRYVDDLLQIGRLPEVIQEAFDEGSLEKGKALSLARLKDPDLQIYTYEALRGMRLTVKDYNEYVSSVLEDRTESVQPAPQPQPSEPYLPTCDVCGGKEDPRFVSQVCLCAECLGSARMAWRMAQTSTEPQATS